MPRLNRIVLGLACAAATAIAPAVAQAGTTIETTQTITLRAHYKNISGYAGPRNTSGILPAGKLYVAEVSGLISYYAKRQYMKPTKPWSIVCGEPVIGPHGALGIDAEFVFARPWTSPCPLKLPVRWNNLEMSTDNGTSYAHPAPLGGPFTAPTPTHEYSYPLIGSNRYALFRLKDLPGGNPATADNYGSLTVQIRPAVPADCGGTGYLLFDEPTEEACVTATS
jgi:hypothetical protein